MKWDFNKIFEKIFPDKTVVTKFLWNPTDGEWRWLEKATYARTRWSGSGWGIWWTKVNWMD